MGVLDKIAELHTPFFHERERWCRSCSSDGELGTLLIPWPCPTRRLCDEASVTYSPHEGQRELDGYRLPSQEQDVVVEGTVETMPAVEWVSYSADDDPVATARADAARLAAAAGSYLTAEDTFWGPDPQDADLDALRTSAASLRAALAAHDALSAETEGT